MLEHPFFAEQNMLENFDLNPNRPGLEEPDSTPTHCSVTNTDIFVLIYSIFTHIIDAGLDIYLALSYYFNNEMEYFAWTVVFILFPAIINTSVSLSMYAQDAEDSGSKKRTPWSYLKRGETRCEGIFRVVMLVLQLSSTLRCYDSLKYALASRRAERKKDKIEQKIQYENMLKEDSDISLLRLFECFLESAPQLALQLTIILRKSGQWKTLQIISIASSFLSTVWSIAGYHRAIRFAQSDKLNISWTGTTIQFLWHLCITLSRILSISAAATIFPIWTIVGCLIHSGIMTTWVFFLERSPFCANSLCHSFLFSGVLGLVYLFTYIMPHDGRTLKRYIFYYSVCFCEISVCVCLYAIYAGEILRQTYYYKAVIITGIVPYIIGIAFMILYYVKYHPKVTLKPVGPT